MHIRKYDVDYGRRKMMEKTAKGLGYAGVLGSVWPMLAKGQSTDIKMAYPDEQISIEEHTKGKISVGDTITADNLEHVEHLLDPIAVEEVRNDGRQIKIREATTDVLDLFEEPFLEQTIANRGKTVVDDDGNIWYEKQGTPAKGGLPFPEPKNAYEAQANINYGWGRHNYSQYAIKDWDIGPDGDVQYQYEFVWSELQVTVRPDGKV